MLQLIFATIVVVFVVVADEYASQKKLISGELARKIPHVTLSVVFAVLPFFIGLHRVAIMAGIDVLIVMLVYKFDWFAHSRTIDRLTWGDFFFLFGTIWAALIANSNWVFVAALLIMGIADAAAALVGKARGKHKYKILLGNTKSVEGTLTFILVATAITMGVVFVSPIVLSSTWLVVLLLPAATSLVEALTPFGLDNMLIPVFVTLVLNSLLVIAP